MSSVVYDRLCVWDPVLCPRGSILDPKKAGKGSSIAQKAEPFFANWL